MRNRLFQLTVCIGFGLTAAVGFAQPRVIAPEEASKNVSRLVTEIPWQTSLATAKAQARRENKLVFWVHMRGKIDGYS